MARRGPKGYDDSQLLLRMAKRLNANRKISAHAAALAVANGDESMARRLDKKFLDLFRYTPPADVVFGMRVVLAMRSSIEPFKDLAKLLDADKVMQRVRRSGALVEHSELWADDEFWKVVDQVRPLDRAIEIYLKRRPRRRGKERITDKPGNRAGNTYKEPDDQ